MVTGPKPSTLIGEKGDALLGYVAQGYSSVEACTLAGVAYHTFRHWLLKGGDPETTSTVAAPPDVVVEPYWSFSRRYRDAVREGKKRDVPRPHRGRYPNALAPDQQDALCRRLAQGWTYHAACLDARVKLNTFLSWLRLGGYPRAVLFTHPLDPAFVEEPYAGFVRRVLAAEAEAFENAA